MAIETSKAPCAALTMVRGNSTFLRLWLTHYRRLLPAEQIYLINDGSTPLPEDLIAGVNVINLPMLTLDTDPHGRRWRVMSLWTSGLTQFYNWVLATEVDELLVLDPAIGTDLVSYLMVQREREGVPQVLVPFPVEMVHLPAIEPEPLLEGAAVIGRRRSYRLNARAARQSITRVPVEFKEHGQASGARTVDLAPDLYAFRLAMIDRDLHTAEGPDRAVIDALRHPDALPGLLDRLADSTPVAETLEHAAFRHRMIEEREACKGGMIMGGGQSDTCYRLPSRFDGII